MITKLYPSNAQEGITEAAPGDVLLLDPGLYVGLSVAGKSDITIIGEQDGVFCQGFTIGYSEDIFVDGVSTISSTRWPLSISRCNRVWCNIVTVSQPWPIRSRPEYNNAKVVDIAYCNGVHLSGAAIGWGRKTLGIYRSSYVTVDNFYARYDGYLRNGSPYTGKCLAPSYHNTNLRMFDVVAEAGEDPRHTCDLFSSDKSADLQAMITINRMLLSSSPGGLKNRYGFGWLRNDAAWGVTVRDLTLDIATGNCIKIESPTHLHKNEMTSFEMIGLKQDIIDNNAWEIEASWDGSPELPRLTDRLKERVTEATRRSDVPTKVFA